MSPFLQLILVLSIIISAAKLGGLISARLGQPSVLGELLAGLILGPTVADLFHLPLFPDEHLLETVKHLAEIGVVLLMFVAGMEIDLAELARTGRIATLAGVGGVLVPVILGAITALLFAFPGLNALFVGIVLSATSVSISAQTLIELGVLRSREGITLLGAAVIDDVLVILVLSLFLALTGGTGGGLVSVLLIALQMAVYLGLALAVALWLLPRLVGVVSRLPISEGVTTLAVVLALLLAWSAETLGGVAAITGAFIAGVGLGRSPLHERIQSGMRTLAYAFFVPIFFVSIGLEANLRALTGGMVAFAVALSLVAAVSKVIGSGLGARAGGLAADEALRLGLGMISRGEVGLIVASVGLGAELITPEVFTAVVIMVLVTTLVTPLLLRAAFTRQAEARPIKPQAEVELENG
jgi:Kef-type K+ transport system membrane component KefB